MVRLVIKTPLANDKICTSVLHHLNHLREFLLLVGLKLLIFLNGSDVELMFCFRAWGFEGAGEDSDFRIFDGPGHLWMRHVLVDDDTLDQCGIFQRATYFRVYFDEFKVNIFPLEVRDREDSIDCDLRKLLVSFGDTEVRSLSADHR